MITIKTTVATIIFCIFLLILLYLIFANIGVRKKIVVKFLRGLLIILLLFLLFRIEYKMPQKIDKINLVFLIDTSYSMKFNNRLEQIKNVISKNYDKLKKKYNVQFYEFNKNLIQINETEKLKPTKYETKIHSAVDQLLSILGNPSIVFLFSDGINNTNEVPAVKKENCFIIPVAFNEKKFKDISITDLRYSKTGFKDVEHKISLEIMSFGYDSITCNVKLINLSNKEVVVNKDFTLNEGKNVVELNFTPRTTGKFNFLISISQFKDEITYENNNVSINIDVKKNKIRVLYLCGQPSPEYYNLRSLLKNDPSIDLVSFVILRNPEDVVIVPDEDLALIPFPTYDIFVKELFNYDLVIFENFSYRRFGITNEYLENIRKFVYSGGGFIMIGGENSFFLGGYKFTPIEEILPVELSLDERWVYSEFRPDYIDYNHPLLKIFDNEKDNEYVWKNVPLLGNYQKVRGVKKEAVVLLRYQNIPLMSYTTVAKGRVFALLTNTTWRWTLGNLLSEKYDYRELYTKLWKNIIYFTSGAEEVKNLYIVCPEENNLNEQIGINIFINLPEEIELKPEVYIITPDKRKEFLYPKKISKEKYTTSFIPVLEGKYYINAIARVGKNVIKEEKEITVGKKELSNELSFLKVNVEYMKNIADYYNTELQYIENLNIEHICEKIKNVVSKQFVSVEEVYRKLPIGILFILIFITEIFIAKIK